MFTDEKIKWVLYGFTGDRPRVSDDHAFLWSVRVYGLRTFSSRFVFLDPFVQQTTGSDGDWSGAISSVLLQEIFYKARREGARSRLNPKICVEL
jgi:hypothetical protein